MATATTGNAPCDYALGYTDAEHERLIRQASFIAPVTERFLREAGVGTGQRVLDLGSGVGDVSMAIARLVGPMGEVVGIERDRASISKAQERCKAAGFHNVSFEHANVSDLYGEKSFDAVVGRFILMFLPDPEAVLRSVASFVRLGGAVAFQEVSWIPMLALGARLPLWSQVLCTIHQTLLHSGANPEMGLDLYPLYQRIGLPAPNMHMDVLLGSTPGFTDVILGVLRSLCPLAVKNHAPVSALGDMETLPERVQTEIASVNTVVSVVPLVSAFSRKTAKM